MSDVKKKIQSKDDQVKDGKGLNDIIIDQNFLIDQVSIKRKIPQSITPQQLIDFAQAKSPFMKFHKLLKHDICSKYKEDFTNDTGIIANQRLQLDQFDYKSNYPLLYNQSTSKNTYSRYQESPIKTPIFLPQRQSIPLNKEFINKNSTYSSNYVCHEVQRSISMKPAPTQHIQLPYLQKIQSVYDKNYDLKYAPYFQPVQKVKKNKNESELQKIIQFDSVHYSNRDSVYKKNYITLNLPMQQRVSRIDNSQTIIASPSFHGRYSSEFHSEYKPKSVKKNQEENDYEILQRIAKQVLEIKS